MAIRGTAAHESAGELPHLVRAAVALARAEGFELSCLPSQGHLLQLLAGGRAAPSIAETGTGLGVGLAWLASGADRGARLVSIERDGARAAKARALFARDERVEVLTGDWHLLEDRGPFDLLVLDGGGQGKAGEEPADPERWLKPGGLVVIDDFSPATSWPPLFEGRPDTARLHWLGHPHLSACEIATEPGHATLVASYWPRSGPQSGEAASGSPSADQAS